MTGKNGIVHKAWLTSHIITAAFYTIPVRAHVSEMHACMTLANEHAAARSLLQVKGFIDAFFCTSHPDPRGVSVEPTLPLINHLTAPYVHLTANLGTSTLPLTSPTTS